MDSEIFPLELNLAQTPDVCSVLAKYKFAFIKWQINQ